MTDDSQAVFRVSDIMRTGERHKGNPWYYVAREAERLDVLESVCYENFPHRMKWSTGWISI